jgi:hypothetical protein
MPCRVHQWIFEVGSTRLVIKFSQSDSIIYGNPKVTQLVSFVAGYGIEVVTWCYTTIFKQIPIQIKDDEVRMRNGAIITNCIFSSTNLASAICDVENLTRQE